MSWNEHDPREKRRLKIEAWLIGVFVVSGYVWLGKTVLDTMVG